MLTSEEYSSETESGWKLRYEVLCTLRAHEEENARLTAERAAAENSVSDLLAEVEQLRARIQRGGVDRLAARPTIDRETLAKLAAIAWDSEWCDPDTTYREAIIIRLRAVLAALNIDVPEDSGAVNAVINEEDSDE